MELVERDLALAFHRTLSVSAFSLAGFAGSVEFHFVIIPLFSSQYRFKTLLQ